VYEFTIGVVGAEPLHAKVFVVPEEARVATIIHAVMGNLFLLLVVHARRPSA
jgi:uncharacterized membrane protein YeaQ/YmgE (transglycosylase-associated protein family)